jgi:uncharacterized protein YecE (DUF72 family)
MGKIFVGISSWADPELNKSGFYPSEVKKPAERLRFYASNFPIVEMDSSYHFLPSRRNLTSWIESTPPGFMFEVKAFSLLTQHPTPISSLPRDIRAKTGSASNKNSNLYIHSLPEGLADEIWERFAFSIQPLVLAGKLGPVTFQFPPWFHPRNENYDYILECKAKLPGYRLAIEFRTGSWLNDEHRENTLRFLKQNDLALVCVDEPQGFKSSVPPVAEAAASFGVVRFHGRNRENWERKNITINEKYNYLYTREELQEWASKIRQMGSKAEEIFIIFKNKHRDFPIRNARQMMELLDKSKNQA